jgi:hypothetical protein
VRALTLEHPEPLVEQCVADTVDLGGGKHKDDFYRQRSILRMLNKGLEFASPDDADRSVTGRGSAVGSGVSGSLVHTSMVVVKGHAATDRAR